MKHPPPTIKESIITNKEIWTKPSPDIERPINADPKHAGAYLNLGTIYYNQGKFNHAIMSYKQAILINPDYVEAYLNLGAVYRTAGKL
ncbi:TPA: tetratricopeptide repeat protein [Candidatus Poribacteria bacterium]|nr:tetratricopeptide repeat protein [Candidatus Poribacteria bacterium]